MAWAKKLLPAYLTGFVCFACVAIGFSLGVQTTSAAAKHGITIYENATKAAILRERQK